MRTKTESMRRALPLLLAACFVCPIACADAPIVPAHPLDDLAALKAAFAARIGKPAHVLRFGLGEHYADALVQNDAAPDEFDRYEAVPGQPMKEGEPQKSGSIDCKKKIAFADLDLAAGARVLAEVRAIAPDGSSPKAREMRGDGWAKVDIKKLLAGTAPPPVAEARKTDAPATTGDGRTHDFLQGIEADLARVQAQVGAPLAFKHISLDKEQLSVDVFQPSNKKRVSTYLVDDDGGIKLWREDDTIPFDCNKPFAAADVPLSALPAMIAGAPALIPPMAQGWVKNVHIYRSGLCGSPHVYIEIEDERGFGNVEYDGRGKLISAAVQ